MKDPEQFLQPGDHILYVVNLHRSLEWMVLRYEGNYRTAIAVDMNFEPDRGTMFKIGNPYYIRYVSDIVTRANTGWVTAGSSNDRTAEIDALTAKWNIKAYCSGQPQTVPELEPAPLPERADSKLERLIWEFKRTFYTTRTWNYYTDYDGRLIEEMRKLEDAGFRVSNFWRSRKVMIKRTTPDMPIGQFFEKLITLVGDPVEDWMSISIKRNGVMVQYANWPSVAVAKRRAASKEAAKAAEKERKRQVAEEGRASAKAARAIAAEIKKLQSAKTNTTDSNKDS